MKIKTSTLSAYTKNTENSNAPKTIICMGVPRGGTSMVAGAIAGLGVYMGENLGVNIEDSEFNPDVNRSQTFEDFLRHLPEVISKRNADHGIWGWKYPRANRYISNIFPLLRNPYFVMVYRDPVASATRSRPEDSEAVISEIKRRLSMQSENLKIAEKLKVPTLMVSYERASARPEEFLENLCDFLGLAYPENSEEIINFMKPGQYKSPNFGIR